MKLLQSRNLKLFALLILAVLLVPTNLLAVNAQLTTTLSASTTITNTTVSTNVTQTNINASSSNPLGLPLPNSTTTTGISTTLAGTKIFDNGTLVTSVNGVSMTFLLDPKATTAKAPPAPTNLVASSVSSSQINLSWTAPSSKGGSSVTGYEVQRQYGGQPWMTIVANTHSTATTYSDTGLQQNTKYTYRVMAIDSAGTSSPSNNASATTYPSGEGAAGSITLNGVQYASATLSSSPYQITVSNVNTGTASNNLLVVGISANNAYANSVTFGGAQLTRAESSFVNNDAEFWYLANPSGTGNVVVNMAGSTSAVVGVYSFSGVYQPSPIANVAAKHNSGASSPSISLSTKYTHDWVLDLPSIYGGKTLSSPTCTQDWDVNVPGAITGASSSKVMASTGSVTCGWTASNGGDLWDDVAIEIHASDSMLPTSPSSPTGLTASAVSSSEINLSWVAPSDDGGSAITGYKIDRSTDGGTTWLTIQQNTNSVATTWSDASLTSGTTYTYRVSAINSVGTSQSSNTASAITQSANSSASFKEAQTGLVVSDSLTNETESQQQLQANPGYWIYFGDAPSENAPYSYNRDTHGLHVAVESPSNGTWAGFYAESRNQTAQVWHSVITNPMMSLPSSPSNFANTGMYVQTANKSINYVECGTATNNQTTVWVLVSATGDTVQVTKFNLLWVDNSPNQPLTRDCSLVTNGNNYLEAFIDGKLVYNSTSLNLGMPAPFNVYLEPETSFASKMWNATFHDFYVATNGTVKVTNLPSNAATVSILDNSGNILATTQPSGGVATLDVSPYHFPISGTIKAYDSNKNMIASSPASIYGGDVYSIT